MPQVDYLCMPGGYFWERTSENSSSRTWVNKGKKEGRVRLDWSDVAGSGLWLLED
jgi:hypothetical protein